jgi:hypothetical protein
MISPHNTFLSTAVARQKLKDGGNILRKCRKPPDLIVVRGEIVINAGSFLIRVHNSGVLENLHMMGYRGPGEVCFLCKIHNTAAVARAFHHHAYQVLAHFVTDSVQQFPAALEFILQFPGFLAKSVHHNHTSVQALEQSHYITGFWPQHIGKENRDEAQGMVCVETSSQERIKRSANKPSPK